MTTMPRALIQPASPTLAPHLAARSIITVGTQAPLSTIWTEPASCLTALPTLSAGSCDLTSCSAYTDPSSLASILSSYGASVNYPDFTTSQSQTSTSCMPSGYANLQWFYFTPGTQCPDRWMTATTATDSTAMTIVCCPTGYPTPSSVYGQDNYDCITVSSLTPGASLILAAQGTLAVSSTGTGAYVPFWVKQSIIATTTWPTATTAAIHPGVNFLVDVTATPTPTDTAGDGSGGGGFSLWALSMGGSIGVLVVLGVVGLLGIACLVGCVKCLVGGGRRKEAAAAPVYYQQPPVMVQFPDSQQWGYPPYSPPAPVYGGQK